MAALEVEAVRIFEELLGDMLCEGGELKGTNAIEPPILKADIATELQRLQALENFPKTHDAKKLTQHAVIDTAVRDTFIELLVRSQASCSQRTLLTKPRRNIR
jgi:hypothetical protein